MAAELQPHMAAKGRGRSILHPDGALGCVAKLPATGIADTSLLLSESGGGILGRPTLDLAAAGKVIEGRWTARWPNGCGKGGGAVAGRRDGHGEYSLCWQFGSPTGYTKLH
jgi:hypothetical protein